MALSVVVAPDSFKGSLSAASAARAIAHGWASVRPGDTVTLCPQADGGEGTLDAIEAATPHAVRHSAGLVTGPDGQPTPGEWLLLDGGVAVVELAQCSGLPLMAGLDAAGATTRGFGEVIAAALDAGATSLVLALGGSASTDGGTGALAALGLRLADAAGRPLPDGGAALSSLATLDTTALRTPPPGGVALLTDVTSPLLGPTGAARVFGPQKGATPAVVERLDDALARLAEMVGTATTTPGSGAAGGTAYGFSAVWGAAIRPGAEYIAKLSGLDERVASADVVILGEGRFDEQSLAGKVASHVLAMAGDHGTMPVLIAGQVSTGVSAASGTLAWSLALTDLAGSADAAIAAPERWLHDAGARAARELGSRLEPNVSS
jgi:glycerate kinase